MRSMQENTTSRIHTGKVDLETAQKSQAALNAIKDIRGGINDSINYNVVSQTLEDYGNIFLDILGGNNSKYILQLLNANNEIIREYKNLEELNVENFKFDPVDLKAFTPEEQKNILFREIIDDKVVKEVKSNIEIDGRNTLSPSEGLDVVHFANFVDAIRDNKLPNADVETGYKSTLWVQLGNIAQRVGYTLNIDQHNGHILDNPKASKLWRRDI